MKLRLFLVLTILGFTLSLASPATAAPGCSGVNWRSGDTCTFEAPAGAFAFGGIATAGEGQHAWVAVEVVFNGIVIASCFGSGTTTAQCGGTAQAFAPNLTHVCRVSGTGGPWYGCADPPPLPVDINVG